MADLTSNLNTTTGCEYYTPPTPTPTCTTAGGSGGAAATCSLDNPSAIGNDPHVCCFGSATSNCSNTPSGGFSFDSKDKSGHKIYCASDNKVVRCPGGTRSYTPAPAASGVSGRASVFRSSSDLSSANKSTDCEVVPTSPSTSKCQLPESASCTFGSLSTSDNCYDAKNIRTYNPSGKPPMNLFCTKDNKTIACDSSITAYDQAFPGLTNRGGDYTPPQDAQISVLEWTPFRQQLLKIVRNLKKGLYFMEALLLHQLRTQKKLRRNLQNAYQTNLKQEEQELIKLQILVEKNILEEGLFINAFVMFRITRTMISGDVIYFLFKKMYFIRNCLIRN